MYLLITNNRFQFKYTESNLWVWLTSALAILNVNVQISSRKFCLIKGNNCGIFFIVRNYVKAR